MKQTKAKEDFLAAFWELYREKRFEKITVRELCMRAGYNRSTFYVYFEDIYDLLNQFIQCNICQSVPDREVFLLNFSKPEFIELFITELFEKNSIYIKSIIKNGHFHILEENLINTIKMQVATGNRSPYLDYVFRYQLSGVFGLLQLWILEENKTISKEELIKLIFELSSQGVVPKMKQLI